MSVRPSAKSAKAPARAATKRSAGRPKLTDVAQIEQRLLTVALQAFIEHGYGAASLTQIVKAAGASKTTLYSRFASKEQLFNAIMREQIARLDAATVLKPRSQRLDLAEGLKAYANHMLELNLQGDLLAVNRLMASESHRFPELAAAADERAALGIARISAFVSDCAQADGLRCRDPDAVAEVFIFMLRGWHTNAMLSNRKVPATQRERWVERAVHTLLSARADW